LKYFAGQDEDHLGVPYKGIEGYPDQPTTVRTFGMGELEANLRRHFSEIRFFYPQPDYKLPDCVLRHEFLAGDEAANLSAEMASRSARYMVERRPSFDVAAVTRELARNGMLPVVANSFLAVAGKRKIRGISFDQLAFLVSPGRRPEFRTETRIAIDSAGRLIAAKSIPGGAPYVQAGHVTLRACESPWAGPSSVHAETLARCKEARRRLPEMVEPCRPWADLLVEASFDDGGRRMLGGDFIDCTWDNVFRGDEGPVFIDREWIWSEPIALHVVVIRAIYCFLLRIDIEGESGLAGPLRRSRGRALIRDIAEALGFRLSRRDFTEFVALETAFQSTVFGMSPTRYGTLLRWLLIDRRSLRVARGLRTSVRRLGAAARHRLGRVLRG